jgi:DNA replication protein DnaC
MRRTGLARNTIRSALRSEAPPGFRCPERPSKLDPPRKTLEEFDFTFQHSIKKQVVEHLGQLDFLHAKENVVLLGPPGLVSHCPPCSRHWSKSPFVDSLT